MQPTPWCLADEGADGPKKWHKSIFKKCGSWTANDVDLGPHFVWFRFLILRGNGSTKTEEVDAGVARMPEEGRVGG